MIKHRKILVRLLFVIALLLLGGALPASAGSDAPAGQPLPDVGVRARSLTTDLRQRGFEVSSGYFQLYRIADCPYSFELMKTCYFNNPLAPYVMPVAPLWPDEYVDPATTGPFGPTNAGFAINHRLDPNEAIVIFGTLPPPARFFSVQSFLFTRKGTYQTDNDTYRFLQQIGLADALFHTVPGNPSRIQSWDSFSNSNNNVVIERQSGAAFGQLRYFIITPDRYMDKAVRQALHKLAVRDQDIFSEPIPSNMKFGLDKDADEFMTLIRYAMPADGGGVGTPSDAWRQNPPLTILRVRDTRQRPPQLYPAWVDSSPEPRTAVDEHPLAGDLGNLVDAVRARWGQPCIAANGCTDPSLPFADAQSSPFNLLGPKCDDIGMDCLGDAQDTTYQFRVLPTFDNGEVYAVAGTLGTKTGNATYASLAVNLGSLRLGLTSINDDKLTGSADAYSGVANRDKFYVYYLTRDCTGLEELTGGYCLSVSKDMVPTGDSASIIQRDYIKPGTQRGADSLLMLPARLIKLQRPAP